MNDLIGKVMCLVDNPEQKGRIDHVDPNWLVITWLHPGERDERVVYPKHRRDELLLKLKLDEEE